MEILRVEGLKKYFTPKKERFWKKSGQINKAVDGVDFSLKAHDVMGVVGESGCGKTTMGMTILRLIEPTQGKIWFQGQEITGLPDERLKEVRRKMQVIFQDPYSSLDPMLTLGEIVTEAYEIHQMLTPRERTRKAEELLTTVGLDGSYRIKFPHELSGGQRQRVAIARALALEPQLLIADEPTSALDVSVKAQIINLLEDLKKRIGLSLIFISHDLSVVKHISDSLVVMYLGRIVERGSSELLFSNPMHPYTQVLLEAIPIPDPRQRDRVMRVDTEVGMMEEVKQGCRFFPRCAIARPDCGAHEPGLTEVEPGHWVACHHQKEGLQ